MTNPPPTPESSLNTATSANSKQPTALRCFLGALIAGPFAVGMYYLTTAIATTFANKPLPTGNTITVNIAVAVRTLVVGMSALGMAVFAIATLGLVALGIQLLIQGAKPSNSSES